LINELQKQCSDYDQINLKLELDYKLAEAQNKNNNIDNRNINEFMYFDKKQLIGYIGICCFGGTDAAFEITGMVNPRYRRQGIFSKLHALATSECKRRNAGSILLLCDKKSVSGQNFLKTAGAAYKYSEFEMFLRNEPNEIKREEISGFRLRKATPADVWEVTRQNAIYFGDLHDEENNDIEEERFRLMEDEEKPAMSIYLAEMNELIIGKVHLQIINSIGGIYGLGVLPENRNKGFGRAILMKAINMLKEANVEEIMLQVATGNAAALGLYKSCGFQEVSIMDYYEYTMDQYIKSEATSRAGNSFMEVDKE